MIFQKMNNLEKLETIKKLIYAIESGKIQLIDYKEKHNKDLSWTVSFKILNKKEVEEIKKQLEEAKVKCEEYLNGWKRERADFLNYKKDEMERIGQLVKYSNEELILKIIPILDNIYLAEAHVPEKLKGNAWINGFNLIKNQLCL